MRVRFVDSKAKILAIRSDIICAPLVGQTVILADDKDYQVIEVVWDLFKPDDSQLCVELKLKSAESKK
jgi:hypothetical protein